MRVDFFIVLLVIHFLCDFTHLSTPEMLQAKRTGTPLWPIVKHAFVHAVLMAIAIFFLDGLLAAAIVYIIELSTHLAIDTLKGRLNVWFPPLANASNTFHWYVFGADQLAHILVIILMLHLI